MWHCRMLWSFSRDGGVPGYKLWSSVNKYTGTPINAGMLLLPQKKGCFEAAEFITWSLCLVQPRQSISNCVG